jgi:hypothetical protein
MTNKTYRIGTDQARNVTSNGMGPTQHHKLFVGVRHAVPDNEDTALCGHRPQHVFAGTSWPGIPGRDGFACEACSAAAGR